MQEKPPRSVYSIDSGRNEALAEDFARLGDDYKRIGIYLPDYLRQLGHLVFLHGADDHILLLASIAALDRQDADSPAHL